MTHFQIENNQVARLVTDDYRVRNLVAKGLTFQLPSYKFTKAHKQGGWDGNICFFKRNNNSLDVGLIDLAQEKASEIGLAIPIVDLRPESKSPIVLDSSYDVAHVLEGKVLRDYQEQAIRTIFTRTRGIIQSPTGSGKTVIAAGATRIANLFGKKVLFLTHQKDLLHQTQKSFFKSGIDTGICGDSIRDLVHPTIIATVQTLYAGFEKRNKKGEITKKADPEIITLLKGVDFIFIDECFKAGTKINTPNGLMKIEDIKVGMPVYSELGISTVTATFTNPVPIERIVRVNLSNGKFLICSKDHLFMTELGWVEAINLTSKTIKTNEECYGKKISWTRNPLRPVRNFIQAYFYSSKTLLGKMRSCPAETQSKKLPNLQERILSKFMQPKILLSSLRASIKDSFKNSQNKYEKNQPKISSPDQGANEEQQSNGEQAYKRKNDCHKNKKQNFPSSPKDSRWKWKLYKTAIDFMGSVRSGMETGISDFVRKTSRGLSHKLQGRYSSTTIEACRRSRWFHSPGEKQTDRHEERRQIKSVRVESVENYKRESAERFKISDQIYWINNEPYVNFFDFEVENSHTYFAEGVLVHNCHRGDAMSFQAVCSACTNAYYRIGLTATPLMKGLFEDIALISQTAGVIYRITIADLVKRGLLAQPYIQFIKVTTPLLNQKLAYAAAYKQGIQENEFRNRDIINKGVEFARSGLTTLILVSKIPHGKDLLARFYKYPGLRVQFVHGSKDTDTRTEAFEDLANKRLDILISSTIADEGVDIPAVSAVILAGGMKSPIKQYQRIGRGMRPKEDENWVAIVDYIDLTNKHLARHSMERFTLIRDEPGFIVVPDFNFLLKKAA